MDTVIIYTRKPKPPRKSQPLKKIIGRRIRYLRRTRGENKELLAARLSDEADNSISENAIGQWEDGYTQPSSYWLIALGEHFDVSTDYLLCREFFELSDEELLALPDTEVCRKPASPISEEMQKSMRRRGVTMYG